MKFGSIAIIASCLLGSVLGNSTPSKEAVTSTATGGKANISEILKTFEPSEVLKSVADFKMSLNKYRDARQESLMKRQEAPGLPELPDIPNPFKDIDIDELAKDTGIDKLVETLRPTLDKFGLGGFLSGYDQWKKSISDLAKTWSDLFDGLKGDKPSESSTAAPSSTSGDSTATPSEKL